MIPSDTTGMTLLEEVTLENGLQLFFYDESRQLAGDRWLVKLGCRVEYSLAAGLPGGQPEEGDPALRQEVTERLGERLEYRVERVRNFVDQQEKENVLEELLIAFREHQLPYLAGPVFPGRLLADTWRRLRQECLLARQRRRVAEESTVEDDDDGPSDFSALFR